MLVLDEADRMLDMGFWPDVRRILHKLPPKRQNMFFSATMGKQVLSVIEDTLNKPVFIELGGRAVPIEAIDQRVFPVSHDQKLDLLVEYFRHHEPDRTLIFTRTRRRAERLARTLNHKGVTCAAIHGDRTQGQRQDALDGFKDGRVKVLVATDIVARGIDVEGISHVINYDIPGNPEDYVHRIGRTARAGASGIAVSLLTEEDVHELKAIERLIGATLDRHDLPHFDYDKRDIPESHLVPRKPGKLRLQRRRAALGDGAGGAIASHDERLRRLVYSPSAWATSRWESASSTSWRRWFNSNVARHSRSRHARRRDRRSTSGVWSMSTTRRARRRSVRRIRTPRRGAAPLLGRHRGRPREIASGA